MDTNISYAVANCIKIPFCIASTRFNGCSICETGYAIKFNSTTSIPEYDECIPSPENCNFTSSSSICDVCSDGYVWHQAD